MKDHEHHIDSVHSISNKMADYAKDASEMAKDAADTVKATADAVKVATSKEQESDAKYDQDMGGSIGTTGRKALRTGAKVTAASGVAAGLLGAATLQPELAMYAALAAPASVGAERVAPSIGRITF